MAPKRFSAQVDDFVRKSQARIDGVFRESVERTVDIAQTPVAKGGRMRVDTGFLRGSGQAQIGGLPSGPGRGDPNQAYNYEDSQVSLTIAKMKPGDTFFFGWTANYAKYREYHDAFLRGATEQWSATVRVVVADLKQRIK